MAYALCHDIMMIKVFLQGFFEILSLSLSLLYIERGDVQD